MGGSDSRGERRRATGRLRRVAALPWLAVAVISLAANGCGPRDTRIECSGTVTYAGKPVDEGSIGFFPLAGGGRSEGAVITAGRYTARVQPGRHRIEIRGSRPLAVKTTGPSDMPGGIREDYIPKAFNEQSKLEVEIPATGPHNLPFDLTPGR